MAVLIRKMNFQIQNLPGGLDLCEAHVRHLQRAGALTATETFRVMVMVMMMMMMMMAVIM